MLMLKNPFIEQMITRRIRRIMCSKLKDELSSKQVLQALDQ